MTTEDNSLVRLTPEFTRIAQAFRQMGDAMRELGVGLSLNRRRLVRFDWTRGDRHLDRVCKEIAAGKVENPVIHLIAASDFAAVLDAQPPHWTDRLGA